MNAYIIIYSLENSEEDYRKISKCIKGYPTWAKIFSRTWFVACDNQITDIRDALSKSVNGRGEIIVMKISKTSWASYKVDKKITTWLKENL